MSSEQTTNHPLLTINELAAMLTVDRRTVERWGASGRIPREARVELSARAVRYKRDAIMEWINNGCPSAEE